jgi:large subunit ribosomal protein L29
MSKAQDLREMSSDQLEYSLKEARDTLFHLKCQASTEKLDAPTSVRKARREIARIHTILGERQPSEQPQPTS